MSILSQETIQKIEQLVEQVANRENCKLYHVEFSGGAGGRVLRIYIDKDSEGGASLDDCANVSRGLNLLLDVEDIIPGGHYNLEVSTPGVERPLRKPWHFAAVSGKKVWLKLNRNLQSLGVQSKRVAAYKTLEEVIQSSNDNGVLFSIDNEQAEITYDAIEKAHVVFEFGADKGKKKNEQKINK